MDLKKLLKKMQVLPFSKNGYKVYFGGYSAKAELDQTNTWKITIDGYEEAAMIEIGKQKEAIKAAKEALAGHYLAKREIGERLSWRSRWNKLKQNLKSLSG